MSAGDRPYRATGLLAVIVLFTAGCRYGTEWCIEQRVGRMTSMPVDLTEPAEVRLETLPHESPAESQGEDAEPPPPPPADPASASESGPALSEMSDDTASDADTLRASIEPVVFDETEALAADQNGVEVVSLFQQDDTDTDGVIRQQPLSVPEALPGADAPPLQLPPFDPQKSFEERRDEIRSLYPELPALGPDPLDFDDGTVALRLADLQRMAMDNSPVLRQAAADVEKARGNAIQVGLYPNPRFGYQADTINTGNTAGLNGVFFSQEIVTADKLLIARQSALMEVRAAEAALRKARISLASDVRRGYFDVLVAGERIRLTRALAGLVDDALQAQIDLVQGGEAAPYEALQIRVFAMRVRNKVIQSENEYYAAWRQLAAALGMPQLPPAPLEGSVTVPGPVVDHQAALAYMMSQHTDLAMARSQIGRAATGLRLQQVTPIPNIDVSTTLFHDDTSPANDMAFNVQIGIPVPVFNKNQGNIVTAEADLVRTQQDLQQTYNDLTGRLAAVYATYASNLAISERYRTQILPDQVRVYRGIYDRFWQADASNDFTLVIQAQQTLFAAVNEYLDALSAQWNAVVDLAEVVQVDDLYAMEMLMGGAMPQQLSAPLPVPAPAESLPPADNEDE
ncbi:Cobalt-zinc-cadmium resistance protein CzcC precursor [Maioricimonas rarisocia]|uniref:Cobalt-zinc-cadmium resistance protein CzcC n=1 Tax=Maioricimonas rarisocia TaxID=2528026 RepID=A0A517Z846_9PLAN|nr:TolC family protein [Maioricimonas rarisocia]QDU38654.1 Cobalt-zinc-cadmium resistance protein CzcC precursor [Maioricimonas rarisocia]